LDVKKKTPEHLAMRLGQHLSNYQQMKSCIIIVIDLPATSGESGLLPIAGQPKAPFDDNTYKSYSGTILGFSDYGWKS